MNVLIAPDSFKECLSADNVAYILAESLKNLCPSAAVSVLPLSDGGEGFSVITAKNGAKKQTVPTHDALMRPVTTDFYLSPDKTALIESASACGLALIEPEKRNPLHTTTFGVGEMITAAVKAGAERLIIGLGGSATNDCGIGMMQALGARFYDAHDNPLPDGATGAAMDKAVRVDISKIPPELSDCELILACDVTVPLLGTNGAAAVFAPQKGASAAIVRTLEKKAAVFALLLENTTHKKLTTLSGAGAAGGLGVPLHAFFNARFQSGIDIVLDVLKFDDALKTADLVITGEGRTDAQSLNGKVVSGVAARCLKAHVPLAVVCGQTGAGAETLYTKGVRKIYAVTPADMPFEHARVRAPEFLAAAAARILNDFSMP